jgi:hypothetical protein
VTAGLEISRLEGEDADCKEQSAALLVQFQAEVDPNQKRVHYLEMKRLMANAHYFHAEANFQKFKLAHSIIMDALFPVMTFSAFLFLPLGAGIAVMAAGIALGLLSAYLLNRFQPKKPELPSVGDDEFNRFTLRQDLLFFPEEAAKQASLPVLPGQLVPV